jgi:small subunit ribosomal protein S13
MFLFGANLPELAQVRFALRNVFGVGSFKAGRICDQVGLYPKCRVQDLSEAQISEIGRLIEADPDKCGHELQRRIAQRILHYHNIRSWRGDRYARGLPAHNQNSVTNARTAQ